MEIAQDGDIKYDPEQILSHYGEEKKHVFCQAIGVWLNIATISMVSQQKAGT